MLLQLNDRGLYCARGDFYIDPWQPVDRALLTHAHSDHAHEGSKEYWCTTPSMPIVKKRLGEQTLIRPVAYGENFAIDGVTVSFHPAGHILGSAQIRVEADGETWVMSGDYKRNPDPSCAPFEVVPCDVFISEATFGMPIYRWESGETIARQIYEWWDRNRAAGRASVLLGYSLGKAQRMLAELAKITDRTVFTHGAVESLTQIYRDQGIKMLPTKLVRETEHKREFAGELVIAPPSAHGSTWMRRFGDHDAAFASGWMRIRGNRRRRGYEKGFVLSDHADWPDLIRTIKETGAKKVFVTHGHSETVARYVRETMGIEADTLRTQYGGEPGSEEGG